MKQPLRRLSQGAKRRVRQRLIESLKGGPRTQRTNREFTALVRDLAVFAADLSASATTRHELVVQTVVAFQARVTVAEARAGAALDMSLDRRAWHTDAPVVESLTDVARQLVGLDDQLALRAASCVLEARPGDERARAVQRDVAGSTRPTAGEEPWRVTARKRSQDTRIASALRDLAAGSADELSTNAAAELAAAYHGDAAASKPYLAVLRGTVAHSVAVGSPVAVLRGVLDATVAEMGAGVWERGTRWAGEPPAVSTANLSGLREYFAGKRICLVGNATGSLGEHGAEIDGYDVVIRCGSFALDAARTGTRTDVHATSLQDDGGWDVPVDVRLAFSGAPAAEWVGSLVKRLRPEAQRWVGDESVRWPRSTVMPHALRAALPEPTTHLTMTVLLDYLDVSTTIDLFGLDLRPDAEAPSPTAERDWILSRAVSTGPGKISLR